LKTTIYITRHGQTQWNVEERMQGFQDSPLTEQGIQQALWLRNALQHVHFDVLYTSPSQRAEKTAEILHEQRDCELICHDDLREIYMGDWEGRTRQEVQLQSPDAYVAFWETPHLYIKENGGESYYDLQKRAIGFVNSLLLRHEGETILIVTHAATLKTILNYFAGRALAQLWQPPFIHPTALCKVIAENQRFLIELHGDISHYQDEQE